ncbi:putative O-methyltransferase [Aspergillus affinis]|uniref:putative O-methyltransferase n=1 Tax=Aspergillus affinis TaxID=1070780 RepID=UPI0022FE95C6|nr:putative O-methyltransferase [Aspergillus affinis]KAI9039782.1 putative O-methyltransferase [Aspergillus affinis]
MDTIITQVHSLSQNADQAGRRSIQHALRRLLLELQDPKDIFYQLLNGPVVLTVVRLSMDLKLFEALANSDSPRTVTSLAEQLKAGPDLLARILRYLASHNLIQETGVEEFAGNLTTQLLAKKGTDAIFSHGFHVAGPVLQVTPTFLTETKYQDISETNKTPFQKAFNTDLSASEWLAEHPEQTQHVQQAMLSTQTGEWVQNFESLDNTVNSFIESRQASSDRPFFVDIGGSYGHQTIHLRDKHPSLTGCLVLQDQKHVVDQVPTLEGIKVMAQDIFTPQAIQDARFYYLSRVLHDFPDESCVKILQNIIPAMTSESRILIDETVLPDTNVSWQATMGDLYMMFMAGGKERSERQWRDLAGSAGLQVTHLHVYDSSHHRAVLVLEKE